MGPQGHLTGLECLPENPKRPVGLYASASENTQMPKMYGASRTAGAVRSRWRVALDVVTLSWGGRNTPYSVARPKKGCPQIEVMPARRLHYLDACAPAPS